uniref:Uncharacterized protein n=1 Tax=Pristionchus pacificus TaxID=54126 RepID=A0A2A6B753_PRIPA|eukprot:PDM61694.1 hypothetical protein PRIPAC_51136 [Pristionchus pacificus]
MSVCCPKDQRRADITAPISIVLHCFDNQNQVPRLGQRENKGERGELIPLGRSRKLVILRRALLKMALEER